MPDNAKAIFGAGSDLQIYHDGSNSYIDDADTGSLRIRSNRIRLEKYTGENMIEALEDGAVELYHNGSKKLATTATGIDVTGTVTATGTSVFASLDISGDIDVDGTTNLDIVDIDGAVDMATTLQVTGAANFSDRIGSKYVFPSDASSQTGGVTNYFWKMGRITLAGPQAAEIKLYGLTGYGQGDTIVGTNIIQLRGSNSATVLDGTFHATGDPGIGIQEMRYVPIGSSVFDLYVKLGTFTSLSTTVTCGGTWAPEWTNTGSGSNPASSVDMPAHYALLLGNNIAMYADLSEVVFNDDSNDVDFRVESNGNTHMLFVDAGADSGAGQVVIGSTNPIEGIGAALTVNGLADTRIAIDGANSSGIYMTDSGAEGITIRNALGNLEVYGVAGHEFIFNKGSLDVDFRVESDGNPNMLTVDAGLNIVGFGKLGANSTTKGAYFNDSASNFFHFVLSHTSTEASHSLMFLNRESSDGQLIDFRQADSLEGSISVSGSTVTYTGFSGRHESSGIPVNTPVGTVVSTIDALDVYPATQADTDGGVMPSPKAGQTRADHAQVEVSTSTGDACVYGVVSEFDGNGKLIVTSVGIGSIRVTGACSKGDLLESNGDGTAKVQSDDIVRSKTIGKVTIGNSDTGVKLVSCVMYCG
mgnify:CR=1 FL=1